MQTFLMTLHVMTCLALILVVLLQRGKGADLGAALGGGASQTVFGARGAGNFLTKLTTGAAIVFMCTSLTLAYLGAQQSQLEIFDDDVVDESVLEEIPAAGGDAGDVLLEEIPAAVNHAADTLEEIPAAAEAVAGDALSEITPAAEAATAEVEAAAAEVEAAVEEATGAP